MSGIFISYNRGDGVLARRMTVALRALEIEVWWDQDMPSVVWREEIARRIGELAAVVVLWSPRSRGSDSVHDEALLGHDAKRLVNLLFELEKPPPPFHRINGLPFDGWEGVIPHEGWRRLIVTLDPMLASSGAGAPGALIERLAAQEAEYHKRRRAIERADAAIEVAQADSVRMERVADKARAALDKADAQVEALRQIGASRAVIAAANAEAALADTARCDAEAEVARATTEVEQAQCTRDALHKGFDAWIKEQGGAGGDGRLAASEPVTSPPPPALPPASPPASKLPVETEPPLKPEATDVARREFSPDPPDPRKENWWIIGGIVALFAVAMVWAFWPGEGTNQTPANTSVPAENVSAESTTRSTTAVVETSDPIAAPPNRTWLVETWGIDGDCTNRLIVVRAGSELSFRQIMATGEKIDWKESYTRIDDAVITTPTTRFEARFAGPIERGLALAESATVTRTDVPNRSYEMKRCK